MQRGRQNTRRGHAYRKVFVIEEKRRKIAECGRRYQERGLKRASIALSAAAKSLDYECFAKKTTNEIKKQEFCSIYSCIYLYLYLYGVFPTDVQRGVVQGKQKLCAEEGANCPAIQKLRVEKSI